MPAPVLVGSWHTIYGPGQFGAPVGAAKLIEGVLAGWALPGAAARAVAGLGTGRHPGHVMLRNMPAAPVALELLARSPEAVSSATVRPAAATMDEARIQLGQAVAVYLTAGKATRDRVPIVDLTASEPRILRGGAVSAAQVPRYSAAKFPVAG